MTMTYISDYTQLPFLQAFIEQVGVRPAIGFRPILSCSSCGVTDPAASPWCSNGFHRPPRVQPACVLKYEVPEKDRLAIINKGGLVLNVGQFYNRPADGHQWFDPNGEFYVEFWEGDTLLLGLDFIKD